MIAGALLAKKNLLIDKIDHTIIKSEIDILKKIGVKIIKRKKSLIISREKKLKNTITKKVVLNNMKLYYRANI